MKYAKSLFCLGAALLLLAGAQVALAQRAPRDAADFDDRGLQRYAAGDLDGALADFDEAIRLDPSLKPSLEKYLSEVRKRNAGLKQ